MFAASWRNSPSAEFSKAIVTELIKPGRTIGESIVAGKNEVQDQTLVETYNLLGDPAVVLERPEGEFRLARVPRPFGPDAIEASIDRSSFRGMAEVSWLDTDGKSLYSTRFTVLGTRFTLPEPPAGVREKAAEVRGYVADPRGPFDAIARVGLIGAAAKLKPPAVPAAAIALRRPLDMPKQTLDVVSAGDVLLRTGFDTSSEPATAGAGGDGASGGAKHSGK